MHRLWDSDMIDRTHRSDDAWLADLAALDTPENRQQALKVTVEDWATESLLAAWQAYQVPRTGCGSSPVPSWAIRYLEANLPVVRQRLYQERFGWRWCSTRRFLIDDAGELRKSHERRISDPTRNRRNGRGSRGRLVFLA